MARASAASSRSPTSRARASSPPGRRWRSSSGWQRSSRWYSGLGMASIRCRSASPPGRANSSSSSRPYFSVMTCQPAALNMPRSRSARDQRDHPVQRLAVHVDDPDDLAEFGHAGVDDGLPDRALVEFGVTEQRVLAARGSVAAEPAVQVPAGHRAPDRGGRADADGPGRVVDRVGVLDPARVALQAAERPQHGQVRLIELAEQVVDRVQHGRGVRLDRHPVVGAQVPEPQRGHDRDHRRRRGLMAADLQAAGIGPDPVRVVDDRRGQPEHLALDLGQRVQAGGFLLQLGHGCMTTCPQPGHNPPGIT